MTMRTDAVEHIFQAALAALPHSAGQGIAIAYSGGLDSSVLLHLAAASGRPLHAFHVHHGLSPNADAWENHCAAECARLGVPFAARRVTLSGRQASGTEAAARKARYAALGGLCAEHGVRLLLTAHHLDDQAETVLLQMLRGSGPAGLSGMDAYNRAPALLHNPELLLARPLLAASRAQLEEYARTLGIAHIDDESNADTRYARNALRHEVMPRLAEAFPGYQERFARSARHAAAAQRMLSELAENDLHACMADDSLDLAKVRALSADRAGNLLRHWFAQRGIRLPSASWLAEMQEQALNARDDANLKVSHPDCEVRRHRDRLYLIPKLPELAGMAEDKWDDKEPQMFRWQGEGSIDFPDYGGTLHFELAPLGLDPDWLRQQMLSIAFRRGGEKLKPAPNRPSRTLKQHYQTLGIPAWERERLPMVGVPGQILFAAGIGMDCRKMSASAEHRLVFRWEAK